METLIQDLRYGVRTLLRSPGLTLLAVLSLALGIGANTAIFSLANAVMLRRLPVQNPKQLLLFGDGHWDGITNDFPDRSWHLFSYPFYREIQQKNQVFSGIAAVHSQALRLHALIDRDKDPEPLDTRLVSGNYFSLLGVSPILGQAFSSANDQTPGSYPVAVASYAWWRQRFGSDPSAVGKTLTIGSTVFTIIGVAPPEFSGTTVGESPDLWIPLCMEQQVPPNWEGLNKNLFQSLYLIGRLKPGVSVSEASANVNLFFKQILNEYAGSKPTQKQVHAIAHAQIKLTSAATGLSHVRREFSLPLRVLMVVVGLVLLIACANIANLLLARTSGRNREIATRMAIGAGRGRLMRQLLTESMLLALSAGAMGVVFAWWASRLLLTMVSTGPQTLPLDVSPDISVLVFTLLVSLTTAILSGTVPALRATRLELTPALREGRGTVVAHGRSAFARCLIVSQVALSFALLVGAGLFVRSFVKLASVDPGFNKQGVLQFDMDSSSLPFNVEDSRTTSLYQQVEQRVSALPGVQAASFAMFTFNEGDWIQPAFAEGFNPKSNGDASILNNAVGSAYFEAMGMPLLAGRNFGLQDNATAPKVAIINESMARRFFPNQSAVGKRFGMDKPERQNDIEVVGVVRDAKYDSLDEKPVAAAYYPYSQNPQPFGDLVVRYSGDPEAVASEVRAAIRSINRDLSIFEVSSMARKVDESFVDQSVVAKLSGFFGLLAVFLASIGIYGILSYAVSRRTNEIGIRMALGAERAGVLWLVMREALLLVTAGLLVGLMLALIGERLISSMLFGLSATDPVSFIAALALMVAVAGLAGYLPARKATMVDPMVALRYE